MIDSTKKWIVQRPDEKIVNQFMSALNISSIQAKILVSRGFTDVQEAQQFLEVDETSLHDPFLMNGMKEAVEKIRHAIEENQQIAVYGDYDADGVTSITVIMTALQRLGADAFYMIPNRFEHGYGPHKALFQEIHDLGASLIITVDNGIAGVEQIAFAKSLGLDVIVTDHHEAGDRLPEADVILHPRFPEGHYPFPDLAGVGVAFKLASALLGETPLELLEIVAIGTVADLVPLKGENRFFVKKGIDQLRKTTRPGIQALFSAAGVKQQDVNEETIGFSIGPRLNAPGRLGDANIAVDLLLSEDLLFAQSTADELNQQNKTRQDIVTNIAKEAEEMIEREYSQEIPHVFVLAREGWNPGVVGIVASRITDKYHRPTIILSIDPQTKVAKGSARSIEGFHLYNELVINKELLTHFGGHPVAAGLSLPIEHIKQLRENMDKQAKSRLTSDQLIPKVHIDVPVQINEIDVDALQALDQLRPFGMDFVKPMYLIEQVKASQVRRIGADKNHLKLDVTNGHAKLDVIGFHKGALAHEISPGLTFSMIGDLQINEWNGNKKPQLMLEDLYSDEWQLFDLRGIREPNRWLHTIPLEETKFIAFDSNTVHQFSHVINQPIYLFDENGCTKNDAVVLLDLPNVAEDMERFIRSIQPSRIYAHFFTPQSSYFNTMPTREQFGWYYSFLKSRQTFNLEKNAEQLALHKGWKVDLVYFMTNVFSDLEFVKIESGVVEILDVQSKKSLTDAPSYQKREKQMALEQKLLYAPYYELKEWFDQVRNA